jgi:hypothetical protein
MEGESVVVAIQVLGGLGIGIRKVSLILWPSFRYNPASRTPIFASVLECECLKSVVSDCTT